MTNTVAYGAATFSKMTLNIMKLSIMTHNTKGLFATFSMTTFVIMTLRITTI